MNIDFAEQINLSLEKLDFQKALSIAETALESIPPTEFHAVLGKSLVSQAEDLAGWIEDFNTDRWFIDGFAYDRDEGLDPNDPNDPDDPTVSTGSAIL